ncbi:hypothetical protein [Mesorhizobium sp. B1-1-5]|uniref:hypothetical protein n=1 Tax=Mesorhizobium sp. B1-1-5 TaxID=2589979 RepID=UPI001128EAA9|nr:hypothetical protein [Mesorhizobium sp. B1-1-5]TPO02190.1 hypothetical protein FJ980_18715 [Mesorhizobium sp. B1-1-5]
MATATTTSKFDRAAIMRAAHHYAQMYRGRDWSYAFLLQTGLRNAWATEKAGLTPAQRRADAVAAEIDALRYKTLRYDIVAERRRLDAEAAELRRQIEVTRQVEALSFGPIRLDGSAARASLQAQLAALAA